MGQGFSVVDGMWVIVCFLVAGLLAGGVWSAYNNGSRIVTVILAVAAVVALFLGLRFMFEAMG